MAKAGQIRENTTKMKPEVANREYRIATMVAAGFNNKAIWRAFEAENPSIIADNAVRKLEAGKDIPFDKDERGRISRAINSVRSQVIKLDHQIQTAMHGSTVQVVDADKIKLENLARTSWGHAAMNQVYGSTAYIHLQDDPRRRWELGDPMLLSRLGHIVPTREDGELIDDLDLEMQKVEWGFPRSYVSVWGGEPGVGKSRLTIAMAKLLAEQEQTVLIANGEATASQYRIWLGPKVNGKYIKVINSGMLRLQDLINAAYEIQPVMMIVDSITVIAEAKKGQHGLLSSLVTLKMLSNDEKAGLPHIVLISQLNKQGGLMGSQYLEHMVDFSAHAEKVRGKKDHFRFHVPRKNRGGPTGIGHEWRHTPSGVECVDMTPDGEIPPLQLYQQLPQINEGVVVPSLKRSRKKA